MSLGVSHVPADIPPIHVEEENLAWLDELPNEVLVVHQGLVGAGGGCWLVGGAVREGMRGRSPKDHDLATDLHPEQVQKLFEHTISTGARFGTITVVVEGINIEVTTLRCDGGYSDGRRPDSVDLTGSLRDDLDRRDFTINAMAIDIGRRELYDPHEGLNDLRRRRLRAVGRAQDRLSEDGLRIMRAYRFMDQGDGEIWLCDPSLSRAIVDRKRMLGGVAHERIWQEFHRILEGESASGVLKQMASDGVLSMIMAEGIHPQGPLLSVLGELKKTPPPEMSLAVLLHGRSSREIEEILRRMKAPMAIIKPAIRISSCLGTSPISGDDGVLRSYRHAMSDVLGDFLKVESQWMKQHGICSDDEFNEFKRRLASLPPLKAQEQLIDGHWLMQRTELTQGRRLGRLKSWLHHLQIDRDLATRDQVEEVLCAIQWEHSEPDGWPSPGWPSPAKR